MTTPKKKNPKRPKRKYTDGFRAFILAALDANGGNINRTAKEYGVSNATIRDWVTDRSAMLDPIRQQKKVDLADHLEAYAIRLTQTDTAVPNLRDVGIVLGITIDKLLLLRGQPNAHTLNEERSSRDISKLSRAELRTFLEIMDKADGEPPLAIASNPAERVIVDPTHPDGFYVEVIPDGEIEDDGERGAEAARAGPGGG